MGSKPTKHSDGKPEMRPIASCASNFMRHMVRIIGTAQRGNSEASVILLSVTPTRSPQVTKPLEASVCSTSCGTSNESILRLRRGSISASEIMGRSDNRLVKRLCKSPLPQPALAATALASISSDCALIPNSTK